MERKEAQESVNEASIAAILRTRDGRRQVATMKGLYHTCDGNQAVRRYGLVERCAKNVQADDKGMVVFKSHDGWLVRGRIERSSWEVGIVYCIV